MLGSIVCADDNHSTGGHDGTTGLGAKSDIHVCSEQRRFQGSDRPVSRQGMDLGIENAGSSDDRSVHPVDFVGRACCISRTRQTLTEI